MTIKTADNPDNGDTYRYTLSRDLTDPTVDPSRYSMRVVFVMLNPSTADDRDDDPTIRRCIGFARRTGAPLLTVVNLFAYRATKPVDMLDAGQAGIDIVGPENDLAIAEVMKANNPGIVIAAWGGGLPSFGRLGEQRVAKLQAVCGPLFCLGTTQGGQPRHPLYLLKNTPLRRYLPSGL